MIQITALTLRDLEDVSAKKILPRMTPQHTGTDRHTDKMSLCV